jgi:hypothetical protein
MAEYITIFSRESLVTGVRTPGWLEEVRKSLFTHGMPEIDAIYCSGNLDDGLAALTLAHDPRGTEIRINILETLLYNLDPEGLAEIKGYADTLIDSTATLLLSLTRTFKHQHVLVVASQSMAQGIARVIAERHEYNTNFRMNGYAVFGLGARRFELIANQEVAT